jgi:hypothetical protein
MIDRIKRSTSKEKSMSHEIMNPETAKRLWESPAASQPTPASDNAIPHPGLNGQRVADKSGTDKGLYFIWDGGLKCWVPNPVTYTQIFQDWGGILYLDPDELAQIATGPDMTSGAGIFKSFDADPNFLVSNSQKHYITSPGVLAYCNFRGAEVVSPVLLDLIPPGFNVTYGP